MKRTALIVGHWYAGKTGPPRRIDWIHDAEVTYCRYYDLFDERCCLATFMRWAVTDLGTEWKP